MVGKIMRMQQVAVGIFSEAACGLVLEYVLVAIPNTEHQCFFPFVVAQTESEVSRCL